MRRRMVTLALVLLCLITVAHAAVVEDAASSDADGLTVNTTTLISWMHTVGTAQANRALFVVYLVDEGTAAYTLACTYNGDPMAEHVRSNNTSIAAIFALANPDTGANTVQCTSSVAQRQIAHAVSYYGVDQTTPLGTGCPQSGSGTSASLNCAADSTSILIDGLTRRAGGETCTLGADQTQRINLQGAAFAGCGSTQPGTANDVMSWTWVSSTTHTAHVAAPIIAAAASPQRYLIINELWRAYDTLVRTFLPHPLRAAAVR